MHMAIPASAIPTGNAYTVNVARPLGNASPLPLVTIAAAHLLRRWKIPVRMHLAGDTPALNALRLRLGEAGARPSAFSPAPSNEIPGEGFWKTTVNVVERPAPMGNDDPTDSSNSGANAGLFWAGERDDKKVDWDPLLIALSASASPDGLTTEQTQKPDLWVVSALETEQAGGGEEALRVWVRAGAGAVCVLTRTEIFWQTGNAVFGQSSGSRKIVNAANVASDGDPVSNLTAPFSEPHSELGLFAAGVIAGLMRDLLSENLFDKTMLRAERECLEMRPLHLSRALTEGLAAREAGLATQGAQGFKGFAERTEARRVAFLGPASRPWAHKGR
jgi:hypothetical protein